MITNPKPQPTFVFTDEMREEILKGITLKFSPEVLEEIQRMKIRHAQAEVELLKVIFT